MGNFKDRSDYFLQLATQHNQLLHNTGGRVSYMRLNDEAEFDAAIWKNAHRNVVVLVGFNGRFDVNSERPQAVYSTTLLFLTKATKETATEIELAKDAAYTIMEQWIARFMHDAGEDACPVVYDIDSVNFDEVGPINTQYYGWQLNMTDTPLNRTVVHDQQNWE